MTPYQLRPATPADLALVLDHRRRLFLEMGYDAAATDRSIVIVTELFRAALADGRYRGFFAEDPEGRVVAGGGVISYDFHVGPRDDAPRRSWIVNVFTEPEHRRRGLARLIMDALVELCRAQGWSIVFLHASDDGRPLYESMGFKATNEMILKLRD